MTIGFDNLALNHQLLYGLTLDEYAAGATPPLYDRARPHHVSTLHGGSWNSLANGLPYIDLSPNPDWIDCPAADTADLDFTSEDFSFLMWVRMDARPAIFLCRGQDQVDGYFAGLTAGNALQVTTNQNLAFQTTLGSGLSMGVWYLFGFSRSGASITIYVNGVDATVTPASHVWPATCNRNLNIGTDGLATHFDGRIAGWLLGPRIWGKCMTAAEHLEVFSMEKHWLGV